MNKPHTHAAILHAIAEGKRVEYRHCSNKWTAADHNTILQRILYEATATFRENEFRIAPETVLINGVECPKPGHQNGNHSRIRLSIENCMEPEARSYYYANGTDARTVFDALCKPFKESK